MSSKKYSALLSQSPVHQHRGWASPGCYVNYPLHRACRTALLFGAGGSGVPQHLPHSPACGKPLVPLGCRCPPAAGAAQKPAASRHVLRDWSAEATLSLPAWAPARQTLVQGL